MNTDEREWQAQELAAKAERAGNVLLDLDPLSAGYVPIVRALREPMAVGLSDDFAVRVARLAAARASAAGADSPMENRMLIALGLVLGLSALASALIYGGNWFSAIPAAFGKLGPSSGSWVLLLAGCLGLSWMGEQVRQRNESRTMSPR